jgi:hypothetical protein
MQNLKEFKLSEILHVTTFDIKCISNFDTKLYIVPWKHLTYLGN